MSSHFKVYAEYCANNPVAIEHVVLLGKNPIYKEYEDNVMQNCGRVRLDGFIAKLVQRLCKYPLFFKELLKITKKEAKCCAAIEKALESLTTIAKYINEYKNQQDNKEKLLELETVIHGFKGKINTSGRIYYRDGVLLESTPGKKEKPQPRKFYLFNDFLLHCTEKDSVKDAIPTHLILCRDLLDSPEHQNVIEILVTDTKKVMALQCKSKIEKNEWLKGINHVIEEQTNKQDPTQRLSKQLLLSEWK